MSARQAWLQTLPRKRVAAGALIRDEAGRVCLVHPTYKPRWNLPGGTVEHQEQPSRGAAREVAEELGIEVELGRLLVMDWLVTSPDDPDDALMLVYDGGVLEATRVARIVLPPDELSEAAFVDPDELDQFLTARMATRVRAALDALADGTLAEPDRA